MDNNTSTFNPGRPQDAYFVIRGFVYQVEVTIRAWLQLGANEALELEHGEDIDRFNEEMAQASALSDDKRRERLLEQVKSHEDNVTLTSARVTLANFAAHRRVNQKNNLHLRFRYTTNAAIGQEKPKLLPSFTEPGIKVWQQVVNRQIKGKQRSLALKELRQALLGFSRPEDLTSEASRDSWDQFQEDVKKASNRDFERFVQDFDWSTGDETPQSITASLQLKIIELNFAQSMEEAIEAHRRLFLHVFQLLSQPSLKRLTPSDLQSCLLTPPTKQERDRLKLVDFLISWRDELTARLDLLESNIIDEIRTTSADIQENFAQQLAQQSDANTIEKRLEVAQSLMKEGKWFSALNQIADIRKETQTIQDAATRIRLMGRLAGSEGVCLWHRGEVEEARRSFDEELRWQPEAPSALAHAAFMAADDNPSDAISFAEKARIDAGVWPQATSSLLKALYNQNGWDAVASQLQAEPSIEHDAACAVALAEITLQAGDFTAAETYARRAVAADTSNPNAYRLLADTLLSAIQNASNKERQAKGVEAKFLCNDTLEWTLLAKQHLREAEVSLTRALELMAGWEVARWKVEASVQRATVRFQLNDSGHSLTEEALRDCDYALINNPAHSQALFVKGILLEQDNDQSAALKIYARLRETAEPEGFRFQAALFGARLLADERRWDDIITWLLPHWKPNEKDRGQIDVAVLLMLAYDRKGEIAQVLEIKRALKATFADDPVAWTAAAEQAKREGKFQVVLRYLETALRLASQPTWPGALKRQIAKHLAIEHALRHHYRRAAILFAPLVNTSEPDESLYNYLLCLDKSGRHKQALDIARQVRAGGRAVMPISLIEAEIIEEAGDLALAGQLRHEMMQDHPGQLENILRLAYLEQERQNKGAARQVIEGIPFDLIANVPHRLMAVARARASFGLPDALEYAYRARKLAMGDADVHHQYLSLCHALAPASGDDPLLNIDRVGPECAVHLKLHGKTDIWVLTKSPVIEASDPRQIPIDDSRAQLLLGKRVGEKVTIHQAPFSGVRQHHEIAAIQSKYIFAAHETTEMFAQGVLQHEAFEVWHHEPGNIDELLDHMRGITGRGFEGAQLITDFYRQNAAPLSTVAQLKNQSILDWWSNGFGFQFFVQEGSERELKSAIADLDENTRKDKGLVLDITALLFTCHLEIEHHLLARFPRLIVPEPVREEFANKLRNDESGAPPIGFVFGDGKNIGFEKMNPDTHEARLHFWRRVLRFIDEKTEVAPVYSIARASKEERAIYTRPTLAAVLLAHERNYLLYSDDLRIRRWAQHRYKISGVWTHAVLADLLESDALDEDTYIEYVRRLALSGQGCFPLGRQMWTYLCQHYNWEMNEEIRWFFAQMHQWQWTDPVAVAAVASFIIVTSRLPFPISRKRPFYEAALESLVRDRVGLRVIRQVEKILMLSHLRLTSGALTEEFRFFCLIQEIEGIKIKLTRQEGQQIAHNSLIRSLEDVRSVESGLTLKRGSEHP